MAHEEEKREINRQYLAAKKFKKASGKKTYYDALECYAETLPGWKHDELKGLIWNAVLDIQDEAFEYIQEIRAKHEGEIAKLKAEIAKLKAER